MQHLDGTINVSAYVGQSLRELFAPQLKFESIDYRDIDPHSELIAGIRIYVDEDHVKILSGKCVVPDKDNVDLTLHRGFVYHCAASIQTYLPEHLVEHFRYVFYSKINWCTQHCLIQGNERRISITMENQFLNVAYVVTNVISSNTFEFELYLFPVESDLMKNVFNAIKGN